MLAVPCKVMLREKERVFLYVTAHNLMYEDQDVNLECNNGNNCERLG